MSNFGPSNIKELLDNCSVKPAVNQIERHPFLQQDELLNICKNHSIHVTAYSPLGSLDRPDFIKSEDEPILLDTPKIIEIAKELDASPAQVLLAWAVKCGTSVIPKSVNPSRIEENLNSLKVPLDDALCSQINELDKGFRFVNGSLFAGDHSPYSVSYLWE